MKSKVVLFYYEFTLDNNEVRYVRSPRPIKNLAHAGKIAHRPVVQIKPITGVKYNFIKMKNNVKKS